MHQVYSQPNQKSNVIGNISDQNNQEYIKIYQKNNWIKVGNTNTGNVGWVNIGQNADKQSQIQYQNMLNSLNQQYQQLQAEKQAFDHAYQNKIEQLQYKVNALQNKINNNQQNSESTQSNPQVHRYFKSVNVQTNQDGKTATVTKQWLGKDGKIHKESKQIPVADLQNMSVI
ncbi:SH3 domain-containing protein [Thiotrichales bacterium 19X7-9]|nr:SH3 domain-containing protein [Thiotrichales bacterium 19X7-9]